MAGFDEVCRTSTGARVLGLAVLLASLAFAAWLAFEGGAPLWTWIAVALFVLVSALASVANFGDRWHVGDEALTYRNELTARIGFPRERRLAWAKVLRASDYEGRTWFLSVEGERRWVLDQLAEHDRLGLVFQQLGIPVNSIEKPRPWRRGEPGGRELGDDGPR